MVGGSLLSTPPSLDLLKLLVPGLTLSSRSWFLHLQPVLRVPVDGDRCGVGLSDLCVNRI